jgi:integrase
MQLRFQNAVLLAQEFDDIALLSFEPTEQRRDDQVQRKHARSLGQWRPMEISDSTGCVWQPEDGRRRPPRAAGRRRCRLAEDLQQAAKRTAADDLVFSTWSGKPISPNNVLRRWIFPACSTLGIPNATWLTFRRTYSSWAHDKGVPGKVVAELMGHAKVDITLNVYTQVVHSPNARLRRRSATN